MNIDCKGNGVTPYSQLLERFLHFLTDQVIFLIEGL
jgi:hypothetical protein